ncbi:MAG: RibD family protein, partial [Proteobacteria bacterium]|nr:RibD family protein [Pseudomonadota bacterium]
REHGVGKHSTPLRYSFTVTSQGKPVRSSFIVPICAACVLSCVTPVTRAAHLALGFRVGEVTQTAAIVWTCVTASAARNADGVRIVGRAGKRIDEYVPLDVSVARLERAGIEVLTGVGTAAATEVNAGYLRRVEDGRPLVTLKVATTLDGRIATHAGESRWITGEVARGWAHFLRASHDAVMVGLGTAIADDPRLTCRLPGLEDRSPIRVVVDGRLRLPLTSQIVAGARETPSWMVTLAGGEARRRDAYIESGVEMIEVKAGADDNPDMGLALAALGDRGLTRVLVEGGGKLAAALLKARLVDRLAWFRSPDIMGGDGVPVAEAFGVDALTDMVTFTRLSIVEAGDDILETYAFCG